jgi:hypothetical protein
MRKHAHPTYCLVSTALGFMSLISGISVWFEFTGKIKGFNKADNIQNDSRAKDLRALEFLGGHARSLLAPCDLFSLLDSSELPKKHKDMYSSLLEPRVYIGASGIEYPGWISLNFPEFDITNPAHYAARFCPGRVRAFLSEHTFEHIDPEKLKTASNLFIKYLRPGGYVRTAMPPYRDGHAASPLDTEYGHVAFLSPSALETLFTAAGFSRVVRLEWADETNPSIVYSRLFDQCNGRVRRAFRYDPRNAHLFAPGSPDFDLMTRAINLTFPGDAPQPPPPSAKAAKPLDAAAAAAAVAPAHHPSLVASTFLDVQLERLARAEDAPVARIDRRVAGRITHSTIIDAFK